MATLLPTAGWTIPPGVHEIACWISQAVALPCLGQQKAWVNRIGFELFA